MEQFQTSYTITIDDVQYTVPDDFLGGGGGFNETFIPNSGDPDSYGNISGLTGRWSVYSGTTYQYDYHTPEPVDIIYSGSSATEGSGKDALNADEWVFEGGVLYWEGTNTGDPDALGVNELMIDYWGVDGTTPAFGTEEDLAGMGYPVQFDNTVDQGIVFRFKPVPADVTTWTATVPIRLADRTSTATSGNVTFRALNRSFKEDGYTAVTALTLQDDTVAVDNKIAKVTISGNVSDLTAVAGEIPEVCLIRNTGVAGVDESVTVDELGITVQYA